MKLTSEEDEEIGQDVFIKLQRLNARIALKHGMSEERAVDFLIAGTLFVAAEKYGLEIDQVLEVVKEIAASVQEDELEPATRH